MVLMQTKPITVTEKRKNNREGRELAINAVLVAGGRNYNFNPTTKKVVFFTMLVLCTSYMRKPLVGGKEAVAAWFPPQPGRNGLGLRINYSLGWPSSHCHDNKKPGTAPLRT